MSVFDSLSDALPSPRDDEPPDLRQDIADELGDHLECALRREQLTGGNDGAEDRVVARFGDPAAVARKLWWDALWEKIMSQRLMLGLSAVMVLVCCAALGLTAVWLSQQDQRMQEQSRLFAKLLANSEATSKNLSDQLQESLKQSREFAARLQPFSEWSPVELKFVSGKADGPPVAGVEVNLQSPRSGESIPPLEKTSDGNGIVRFERVKYGSTYLHFNIKHHDTSVFSFSKQFVLPPGESHFETVVCPAVTPTPRSVEIEIAWPDDIRNAGPVLGLYDHFRIESLTASGVWQYSAPLSAEAATLTGSSLHFGGSGPVGLTLVDSDGEASVAKIQPIDSVLNVVDVDDPAGPLFRDYPVVDVLLRKQIAAPLQWPGPEFRLAAAYLILEGTKDNIARVFKTPERRRLGDSIGFGFGASDSDDEPSFKRVDRARMSMPLDLADWQYAIEPSQPNVLLLTPSSKSLAQIREAMTRIDKVFVKLLKDADQRQIDADQRIALWEKEAPQRALDARRKKPFSEWNPVEFRFVEETPDGPPVAGLQVSFWPNGGKDKNDFPTVGAATDQDGRLKFDRVRYGNYALAAQSPERGNWHTSVAVLPGEGLTKTFVQPKAVEPRLVQLRVQWPVELKDRTPFAILPTESFLRIIPQADTVDLPNRFTFLMADWKPKIVGRGDSILELDGPMEGFIAPEKLGAGGLSSLRFLEDVKTRNAEGVTWPSPDWKLEKLQVAMQFSKEATQGALVILRRKEGENLFAFGATLDVSAWTQAWDQTTSPPTVVMSPDDKGHDALLEMLGKVTSTEQYLITRKLSSPVP